MALVSPMRCNLPQCESCDFSSRRAVAAQIRQMALIFAQLRARPPRTYAPSWSSCAPMNLPHARNLSYLES